MQWLWARHLAVGPGPQGSRKGVPSQLLHVPRVSETAVHRRRALRLGRQQVYMQRGLSRREGADTAL